MFRATNHTARPARSCDLVDLPIMPPFFRSKRRLLLSSALLLIGITAVGFVLRPQKECQAESVAAAKTGSTAAGSQPAGASSAPAIKVRTLSVRTERFEVALPATGTLVPRETVTLVSELSRRLARIHVEEGQQVKKGALLFELDTTELTAERGRLDVQLELARKSAVRQRELVRAQVGTEAEAEVAETQVEELLASRKMLDVTLSKASIRAPFSGTLGLRKVSVGTWVTSATPLITLSDTSQLKIDFRIPERHASAIKVGSTFRLSVDGQAQPLSGTVLATEPSVDVDSRSLAVRGIVDGTGLVPGTFAKVELPVVVPQAILVPNMAVIPGVTGRGVFVVRQGRAHLSPVELGERTPDRVQVLAGLKEGDQVIVSNLLRVQEGTAVQVDDAARVEPSQP